MSPEALVGIKVLWQMMKFTSAKNALELPMRLAFADFNIPKKQAEMTLVQARMHQNILTALQGWGIWPKP